MDNQNFALFESAFNLPENMDQIKISHIEVYNWGSFCGLNQVNINPDGTLITGENGAGKSTVIDALMALLRSPSKASFNIAASQNTRDRSLVSYIRGSYGRSLDENEQVCQNLRTGSTVTVVKAVYRHTHTADIVMLLGIFYITVTGSALSDVKRIYAVGSTEISVKDILRHFNNFDSRMLKAYLRAQDDVRVCDDNFSEYETHFRRRLRMDNANAPALLSRALGLKKIDNLTELIRTLVLEPSDIRKDAQESVKQFEDLSVAHEKLEIAKSQESVLSRLPVLKNDIENYEIRIAETLQAISSLDRYVATFAIEAKKRRHKEASDECALKRQDHENAEIRKKEAEENAEMCHESYIKHGGGMIERYRKELDNKKLELSRAESCLRDYNTLAALLDLDSPDSEEIFRQNLVKLQQLDEKLNLQQDEMGCKIGELNAVQRNQVKEAQDLENEIRTLELNPDSNLDQRYQNLRNELLADLRLDKNTLVYAAELMEVRPEEESWHGAIERALGGIRQTLLVSEEHYRSITGWLNRRHTGLHVRVRVADTSRRYDVSFGNRGYLQKLRWKDHAYTGWLKNFLSSKDLICVGSVEEMNDTEYSMTREGLIHRQHGFFEKKDITRIDDRHEWCLGFSSKERLAVLRQDRKLLVERRNGILEEIADVRAKLEGVKTSLRNTMLLSERKNYREIDVKSIRDEHYQLELQLDKLTNSEDLQSYLNDWEDAKKRQREMELICTRIYGEIKVLEDNLKQLEKELNDLENKLREPISEKARSMLDQTIGTMNISAAEIIEKEKMIADYLSGQKDSLVAEKNRAEKEVVTDMSTFSSRWPAESATWGQKIVDLPAYLSYLNTIRTDGLPKLVDDFKAKLNNEVTQSVAILSEKIRRELDDITRRIEKVNSVLARAEFRENTFLKIHPEKIRIPFINDFDKEVKNVLSLVTSDDHEARFRGLSKVVKILDDALNSSSLESRQLLDPRVRMRFLAKEIERGTEIVRDVLDSSSGKSGGEKEAFAGSVLAASLAYVLTPDRGAWPVYSSVFLDEAFSNTSDSVSSRVLRIFRELKLHVNLITPFKNIDIARDYARSLVIMTKSPQNESFVSELTWEEYDSRLSMKRREREEEDQEIIEEAGITVEETDAGTAAG